MPALRLKCLLRDLRMKRHLSQEELAQQLKVLGLSASQQLISQIENGSKTMSPLQWRACSKILKYSMEEFYDWPF